MSTNTKMLNLKVADVSENEYDGQVPSDATVNEVLEALTREMAAPAGSSARPTTFSLLHDSSGRHLNGSEVVGDVLESGDRVTLTPSVDAG